MCRNLNDRKAPFGQRLLSLAKTIAVEQEKKGTRLNRGQIPAPRRSACAKTGTQYERNGLLLELGFATCRVETRMSNRPPSRNCVAQE